MGPRAGSVQDGVLSVGKKQGAKALGACDVLNAELTQNVEVCLSTHQITVNEDSICKVSGLAVTCSGL